MAGPPGFEPEMMESKSTDVATPKKVMCGTMDYYLIKQKIYSEINVRSMTDVKLYQFIQTLFKDEQEADIFMLTDGYGGFTLGQLNEIKLRIKKGKNDLSFLNVKKEINSSDNITTLYYR